MNSLRIVLTSIISTITYVNILAQSLLPVIIDHDTLLIQDNSPYIINEGLTIADNVNVVIEAGVEIKIAGNKSILIKGNLIAKGTVEDPITITSIDNDKWKDIQTSYANVEFYHTHFSNALRLFNANHGDKFILSNCKTDNVFGGSDCIAIHYYKSVLIDSCILEGNVAYSRVDAIDADDVDTCIIRNNHIYNFEDDGVDIGTGTSYASIYLNTINNCNYGISVGERSYAYAYRNLIIGCDGGIQSHSGSTVYVENNTLYMNNIGVECHHHGDANSGGNATVINTIISQSLNSDFDLQDNSTLSISYSLSDKEELPGDSNLFAGPLFINSDSGNFYLDSLSPCINSGSPLSPKDSNNNNIDIGCFEYGDILVNDSVKIPLLIDQEKYLENGILNCYPNPFSGNLVIENNFKSFCRYTVNVYNIYGGLVKKDILRANTTILNTSELPVGIYVVNINKGSVLIKNFKIIKK